MEGEFIKHQRVLLGGVGGGFDTSTQSGTITHGDSTSHVVKSNNTARSPLEILPEEMWQEIFSHRHSCERDQTQNQLVGSDLLSCSRVCKDFERLLRSSETTWLFAEIIPHLFPHLPTANILRCREICKDWNYGVDKFFRNMIHQRTYDETPFLRKHFRGTLTTLNRLRELKLQYAFRDERRGREEKFSSMFSSTHGNTGRSPFILNLMCAIAQIGAGTGDSRRQQLAYWEKITNIATKFGKHVELFSFSLSPQFFGGVENNCRSYHQFIRALSNCLDQLQNLYFLEVDGGVATNKIILPSQLKEFEDVTKFPKLSKLTMLRLDTLKDPSFLIQKCLVSLHAEQLTRLWIRISNDLNSWNLPMEFKCLKELHVTVEYYKNFETFICGLYDSPQPPKLVTFGLTLCQLTLNTEIQGKMFQVMSGFGPYLQSLVIGAETGSIFDQPVPFSNDISVKINYPVLTSVKIVEFSYLSLNFLLNFSNTLEELTFVMTNGMSREKAYHEEVIDCYDHMRTMELYKSNAWEKLPRLRLLELQGRYWLGGRYYRKEMCRNVNYLETL